MIRKSKIKEHPIPEGQYAPAYRILVSGNMKFGK